MAFSFKIKQNFQKGFKKDALLQDAAAVGTALWYTLVPTLFKLDGWLAFCVGGLLPYIGGKAFDIPGMSTTSLGIMATHALYAKGNGTVNDIFGTPIWTLEGTQVGATTKTISVPQAADTTTPINGLYDAQYLQAPSGEQFLTYNPREIEAQAYNVPQMQEERGTAQISDIIDVDSMESTLAGLSNGAISWDSDRTRSEWSI